MAVNTTNAKVAYEFFLAKGLTPAQAAGIVGNLQAESSINPESVNSIGCVGIAQWCYGRRANVQKTGDQQKDLQAQLDLIWREMNTTEGHSLTLLKGASTPRAAALAFEAGFERSGGALLGARQNYAEQVFALATSGNWVANAIAADLSTAQNIVFSPGTGGIGVGDTGKGSLSNIPLVGPLVSTGEFLGKIGTILWNRTFWLRVGELILGFTMLLVGVWMMASETKVGQQVQSVAAVAAI